MTDLFGDYAPERLLIRVWTRTVVRKEITSFGTFFSTLCNESSWLNLVERWFSELTSKRIRRGTFLNVPELITAIEEFMDTWNRNPKPFVWTATVDSIVEKRGRPRTCLRFEFRICVLIQDGNSCTRERRSAAASSGGLSWA